MYKSLKISLKKIFVSKLEQFYLKIGDNLFISDLFVKHMCNTCLCMFNLFVNQSLFDVVNLRGWEDVNVEFLVLPFPMYFNATFKELNCAFLPVNFLSLICKNWSF